MNIFCYPFNIQDWRRDTAGLSLEERGVYRELLDWYYMTDGKLTADLKRLERMIGVHSDSERTALATIVNQFFDIKEINDLTSANAVRTLCQKRADDELSKIKSRSISASNAARLRHENAKSNKNNELTSANALPTQCERNANYELRIIDTSLDKSNDVDGWHRGNATPPTPPPKAKFEKQEFYHGEANEGLLDPRQLVPLASDFDPVDEWGDYAAKLGLTPSEALRELEKFTAYFTQGKGAGKRRNKRGWRQSWSNWISKATNGRI